jgi:hypothetical protein
MRHIRHTLRFIAVLVFSLLTPWQVTHSGAEVLPQDALGGKTLMTFCTGKTDVDSGVCSGYIMAVAEAMSGGQAMYGQKACNLEGIKAQQLSDLVRMDITENPTIQTMKAGPMVAAVMAKSFPCYNDYAPAAGGEINGDDNRILAEPLKAPQAEPVNRSIKAKPSSSLTGPDREMPSFVGQQ